ncbi:MAG: hypothetical protein WC450_11235, partial [Candidatus Omnitrophota bacterium]
FRGEEGFIYIVYEKYVFDEKGALIGIRNDGPSRDVYLMPPDQRQRNGDNQRVWVIFSHERPELKKLMLMELDRQGKRIKEYQTGGASIFLYRLNPKENRMPH